MSIEHFGQCGTSAAGEWFVERNDNWPGQASALRVDKLLHQSESPFQKILVFYKSAFMALMAFMAIISFSLLMCSHWPNVSQLAREFNHNLISFNSFFLVSNTAECSYSTASFNSRRGMRCAHIDVLTGFNNFSSQCNTRLRLQKLLRECHYFATAQESERERGQPGKRLVRRPPYGGFEKFGRKHS